MEDASYYKIYYNDAPGSGCRLGPDGNPVACTLLAERVHGASYSHTKPVPEGNHYWVVACNDSGCSDIDNDNPAVAWSAEEFVTRVHVIDGVINPRVRLDPDCVEDCEHAMYPGAGSADFATVKEVTGIDMGLTNPGSMRRMARYREDIESGDTANLRLVLSAADIEGAVEDGAYAIMLYLQRRPEDSDWKLEGDLANLRRWYDEGLRVLQISYGHNPPSRPDAHTPGERLGYGGREGDEKGLTDLGRTIIAEMNKLGMIVDCSHCTRQTTLDAAAASTKPIIANHANAEALTPHRRNKDDDELRAIAATGGVIGVTTIRWMLERGGSGEAGMDDLIAHIEYMVGLVGIDHVGVSTDAWMDGWERNSGHYADADLAALNRWVLLASRLYARGWTEEDLAKLLGGNFRRVFSEVLPAG